MPSIQITHQPCRRKAIRSHAMTRAFSDQSFYCYCPGTHAASGSQTTKDHVSTKVRTSPFAQGMEIHFYTAGNGQYRSQNSDAQPDNILNTV